MRSTRTACVLLLLLLPVLAGCARPASDDAAQRDPAPLIRRVEGESYVRAGDACSEGVDAVVGHLYQAWASEGLVVRVPRPGCFLEFDVDLPRDMEFRRFRAVGGAQEGSGSLLLQVDGEPVASGTFPWTGDPAVHVFRETQTVAAGRHTLQVLYEADDGPAMELDYLEAEGRGSTHVAAASPEPQEPVERQSPASPIGRAGPLRMEAEDMDRGDTDCDPDAEGQRTQRTQRQDASGGAAVVLPRGGCGILFQAVNLQAEGRFTEYRAGLRAEEGTEVRLRVLVDGRSVATALVKQEEDNVQDILFSGRFDTPSEVPAGRQDVRVEYQVVSGSSRTDLTLDYIQFEPR